MVISASSLINWISTGLLRVRLPGRVGPVLAALLFERVLMWVSACDVGGDAHRVVQPSSRSRSAAPMVIT